MSVDGHILKKKLAAGQRVVGLFWKSESAAMVEAAGEAGYDFFIIDLQHGTHDLASMQSLIRASERRQMAALVRVWGIEESAILRPLEAGAAGVLVPHVSTRSEAERVVRSAMYFPLGQRGVDLYSRAANYGMTRQETYFSEANEATFLAVQVEGVEGLENLDGITDVSGIALVFVGPYDLSQSLGLPGQVAHPKVVKCIEGIIRLCRSKGVHVGTYCDDLDSARQWLAAGVQFIAIGVDVATFYRACCEIVVSLREC